MGLAKEFVFPSQHSDYEIQYVDSASQTKSISIELPFRKNHD